MELEFSLRETGATWKEALKAKQEAMAHAATAAMDETLADAKRRARASIAAAPGHFAARWPNALRTQRYPKRGEAVGPAGLVWVRSTYAGIFEDGGTINGQPFLWLPLPGVPASIGGKRVRPGLFKNLITIARPGKPPMLGLRARGTDAQFANLRPSFLLRGGNKKSGSIRVIPLFVGIPAAQMKKLFDVKGAVEAASEGLAARYHRNYSDPA